MTGGIVARGYQAKSKEGLSEEETITAGHTHKKNDDDVRRLLASFFLVRVCRVCLPACPFICPPASRPFSYLVPYLRPYTPVALGARDVCLVSENPTFSVPGLYGCEGQWSSDYVSAWSDYTPPLPFFLLPITPPHPSPHFTSPPLPLPPPLLFLPSFLPTSLPIYYTSSILRPADPPPTPHPLYPHPHPPTTVLHLSPVHSLPSRTKPPSLTPP